MVQTIAIIFLSVALVIVVLRKKEKTDDVGLKLILEQVNELSRTMDSKIGESTKNMNDAVRHQFGESQKLIKEITGELSQVKETGRQVMNVTEQLKSLQDILKNPKQRGVLGEYYLETLLKNILPPTGYEMQYHFTNGEIVDAAVFVKDKIIPVDSKFSIENYNRAVEERDPFQKEKYEKLFRDDIKKRIEETSKYIRPSEGTLDFAFMFIPHEAIYYDLLINNFIQTAAQKYNVIIVSPTSFLAYLQTVLQGLKALQIEETAKDIVKRVEELGKHLKAYEEYHMKLGNALGTTVNHYNTTGKSFKMIDKDVMRITGEAVGIETLVIDKPEE